MRTTALRLLAGGVATAGLLVVGAGVASADPSCLQQSVTGVVADPLAAITGVLGDPLAAAQADLACVQQVLGH